MSFNALSLAKMPTSNPGATIFRSQYRVAKATQEINEQAEGLFYPVFIASAEVITDDRLCALGQTGQRQR